ncbi:enhancer of polycomb homolog 1-like isoform X2 [Scleropages formosus]|uniref:Enhancer of polycomb homolog n=1 Tax=Scleropages formosus TaxID=113540 RepID=A0A8C9RBC0_SCLFO|nr:enhancer of polycomb homolog 1-like isoform X2 [Scleropages formosus]XP_018613373.2 enhancer of polycomb homolog 1-like isoform X2 [Scleropages formosus]
MRFRNVPPRWRLDRSRTLFVRLTEEHHLQRAISAQQVYGEKRDNMVIPVPEAESNISYYDSLYPGEFRMPKQLIHIQPFSLDTEQPDYDLDSDDEAFVNKLRKKMEITPLQFEEMIDRLEKGSGQQLVTLQEAKLLLKEDDDLIREVFDYWTRKRKACKSASLIPVVKQEKRDGSSTNDPYVAFRRRTEKMQTRKNRKNDEASYEKMLKLRRDLSRAVTILEMIKRREKSKRELLHLTLEIVEKRYSMADFGGEVMAEVLAQRALIKPTYTMPLIPLSSNQFRHQDHLELKDFKPKPEKTEVVRTKRKYEKKPKVLQPSSSVSQQSGHSSLPAFNAKDLNQYDFPSSDEEPFSQMLSGSSEAEEDSDPDGPFAFRRKAGCQYYAAQPGQGSNWPWCDPGDPRYRYSLTTLTVPHRCVGLARRRVGRGGRFLLDRAHSDLDNVFYGLDPEMHSLPAQSPNGKLASTSESNTSDRPAPPDLGHILLNIKSCRWRHFRPRTLPRDSDSSGLYRGLTRVSMANPRTQTGGSTSQSRTGPGPAPAAALTAEQYQQHQEQLALMQKQQLEQIQQQQAGNAPAALTTQGLVSKTLDSASAQFAASALVTTEELLAIKAKEEIVLGIGVNGVLPGSGVYKGLHLASAAPAALVNTSPPAAVAATTTANTAAPAFHQPSAANSSGMTAQTPSGHGAAAQVLMGNSVRLGMSSAGGTVNSITTLNARHIPRTLTAVPPSALKLAAAATANCQVPKVTAASSLDMVVRENHDQETTALNSIADSTVAMEVT